jgi:hypothetical protein
MRATKTKRKRKVVSPDPILPPSDQREVVMVPLEMLVEPEKNVRIHTKYQIDELARSVTMFGQIRPVVIDEDRVVLAGNGLVAAMRQLGLVEAKCWQLTGLSAKQKKKLMLADNKIFSLGMDVSAVQFEFIRDINDLDIPGFDEGILSTLLANVAGINEQISSYGRMDDNSIASRKESEPTHEGIITPPDAALTGKTLRCPHCGESFWTP